ncbi:hypothetical protein CBR_g39147 [Chara braunii]|uniref:Uncharacterized protein n=1 Tax=Chara braunii TaxID=69332 RepID=A0A388LR12_CHABU|nr:hypothetical protein CBR_g39147 [Chara braunii]|eukprot:GBG84770.1 hypothetical protein CBR_g39147 [Chara braunii]
MKSMVAKLGKNVVVIQEHFEAVRAKKEAKAQKKLEIEEAKRREEEALKFVAEEQARKEKKAEKKKEKVRLEAEWRAEMKKDLDIQAAIRFTEMEDRFISRITQAVAPLGLLRADKGKRKVAYQSASTSASSSEDEGSDTSVTQEISEKTERLCISEKRKRGPEPVFEDSPLMEVPPKRTPKRGILKLVKLSARITRSQAKKGGAKTPNSMRKAADTPASLRKTPVRISPQARGLTPGSKGALARLRYRDNILRELKTLDATELQRICRDEGVIYDKKIDAIFDIVVHRTNVAFTAASVNEVEVIPIADSEEVGADAGDTNVVNE